jgi:hypothetical protein
MTSYATLAQLRQYLPQVAAGVAIDATLQLALDNATDVIRTAMRSLLADPAFDYAAFGAASTAIVLGYDSQYLRLPAFQAGSVTLVEWMTGTNPAAYQAIADQWIEESGKLYRAIGWGASGAYGGRPRYRVTAVWGYGATVPPAIVEVTLQLAVNIYRASDKGGFVEAITTDGSGTMSQVAGLTATQKQTLNAARDQLIVLGV